MSPLATPLLMMSALRSGRYRLPSAWMSSSARTTTSRYGVRAQVASGRGRSTSRLRVRRPRPSRIGRGASRVGRRGSSRARRRSSGRAGVRACCGARAAEVAEHGVAGIGRVDEDDPPVVGVVAALDEAALLHPIDDPRQRSRPRRRVRRRACDIASGPCASRTVRTCRWTRLSEPRSQCLNAPARSRGPHDVSSSRRSSVVLRREVARARRGRRGPAPRHSVNGTLIIYVTCNDDVKRSVTRPGTSSGGRRRWSPGLA